MRPNTSGAEHFEEPVEVSEACEFPFVDPMTGDTLVVVFGAAPLVPYDGKHGVRHDGCERLADVSPDLDCWFCPECRRQGRVSGAWFMDLWQEMA